MLFICGIEIISTLPDAPTRPFSIQFDQYHLTEITWECSKEKLTNFKRCQKLHIKFYLVFWLVQVFGIKETISSEKKKKKSSVKRKGNHKTLPDLVNPIWNFFFLKILQRSFRGFNWFLIKQLSFKHQLYCEVFIVCIILTLQSLSRHYYC